jgi:hypothetical protein
MTDTDRLLPPPGTPGYTGQYRVRNGILYAMQPDGQWVRVRAYADFKTKRTAA